MRAPNPVFFAPTHAATASGGSDSSAPAFSPLYQQIKQLILQGLQSGEWRPGELIPSETDLAARFGVSQGTVRKAIDELALDNLLLRRQGRGTYVATHAQRQVQHRFLRLHADAAASGVSTPGQRHVIDCKKIRASAEVARALGLRTSDSVWQVQRVLSFDQVPVIFEALWLPATPFKGLSQERLASHQGPLYGLFESTFGVRMVRAEEKFRAVLATPDAAQWLGVTPATPLLSVERVAYTYNDQAMEFRRGLYRTEHHHYRNELQ